MLFGTHVSAAGDMAEAPARAAEVGAECFQFFSRPPQGGTGKPVTDELAKRFIANCKKYKQAEWYVHAPYYINFASANNRISYGSISIIREELERASLLKTKYLMAHLGSAKDLGQKKAMTQTVDGLAKMLKGYKGYTQFLIEISAGAGSVIGDTFEEVAEIIERVEKKLRKPKLIGVCFDTAHAFASGYDLRTKTSVNATFKEFDKVIGLNRLKMSHCNDSKAELGERKDRHENLGKGFIGLEGFKAIVKHPKLQKINLILETPKKNPIDDPKNLKILKQMRGK